MYFIIIFFMFNKTFSAKQKYTYIQSFYFGFILELCGLKFLLLKFL